MSVNLETLVPSRSPAAVADFYQAVGQALVDVDNYPDAIARHVTAERRLLGGRIDLGRYTAVVEVGCMNGCMHAETVLARPVKYLGIDLVADSVAALAAALRRRFGVSNARRAAVLDVCDLPRVRSVFREDRVLVTLPFNVFGNLAEPERALDAIRSCGFDLLIFTYRTDPTSTQRRRDYYERCDYTGLFDTIDERGVLFRSREGLHTYAYHEAWITDALTRRRFRSQTTEFGELGRVFWAFSEVTRGES